MDGEMDEEMGGKSVGQKCDQVYEELVGRQWMDGWGGWVNRQIGGRKDATRMVADRVPEWVITQADRWRGENMENK